MNIKTVAYLRVSTSDQDLDKNKSDILFFANENNLGKVHFIEEKISGTIHWKKRELGSVINSLSTDGNLIVSEFSRLGRSMLECMEIIAICLEKGINLYAIKGHWKLDNSIQSKIMAMIFSMLVKLSAISSQKELLKLYEPENKKDYH